MSTELKRTFDYNVLSPQAVMSLISSMNHRDIPYEKKKSLLSVLISKYFLQNKSFNLYSFLNRNHFYLSFIDRLNVGCTLLIKELSQTDVIELNDEYKEDFFIYLISFLKFVDTLPTKTNNDVEITFDFNAMPKLIDYLNDTNKLGITSASLRAELNALVEKIKKNLEEVEKEKKNTTSLLPINEVNILTDIKENVKKLEQIKELKLLKSNLTQKNLEGIVTNFRLYSEKDKIYLIECIKKKTWTYLYFKIPFVDSFDFLVSHPEYQNTCNRFNLLSLFSMSFLKSSNYLDVWKVYFKVDNLIEVFEKIRAINKEFETNLDFDYETYFSDIVKKTLNNIGHISVTDTSELIEYRREELKREFECNFKKLDDYDDFTLYHWVETLIDLDGKEVSLLEYYFSVIDKYFNYFFAYYPYSSEGYKIAYAPIVSENQKGEIFNFIHLIGKITFTGDMLRIVVDKFNIRSHYGYTSNQDNERNLEKTMHRFLRTCFCYHSGNSGNKESFLNSEVVGGIVYTKENLECFNRLVDKITYQGNFANSESYALFFFEVLKNELDFSKTEDFKIIYTLGLNHRSANKIFLKSVIDKLKEDNYTCYSLLSDYTEGEIVERRDGIFKFLKVYFEIN